MCHGMPCRSGGRGAHFPDGLIGEVVFCVGEAGNGLAGDERLAVGQPV
jgi:hypothetical protein